MIQYKNILRICFNKYKIPIFNCFICALSLNLISVMMPLVLSKLVDFICNPVIGINTITEMFVIYCILIIGFICIDYIYAFNWQHLHNEMINRTIATNLFHRLFNSNSEILLNEEKGNLYTILTKDKDEVLYTVQFNIIKSGTSLIALILTVFGILHINLYFGLFIIVFNILPNFLISYLGKENQNVGTKYRSAYSENENLLIDVYSKLDAVKSYGVYDYMCKSLHTKNKEKIYARIVKEKNEISKMYLCKIINIVVLTCIYVLAITFAQHNQLTLGGFLATMLFVNKMQESVNDITSNYVLFKERKASLSHVDWILGLEEDVNTGKQEVLDPDISLQKLSFNFGNRTIYDDVDVEFKKNTITTIMGESGSGKTTLVKILLRHLCNIQGDYFIGNKVSDTIENAIIRDNICCMQQEHTLFRRDIGYNITLGREIDEEKMEKIIKRLKIDHIVDKHLQSWNTVIEDENTLSGGEIQKLLIARVLLSNANCLIFDEPTAALDKRSRAIFFDLIQEAKKDKVIILFTHDLEAIEKSDYVFKICNHKINEVRGDIYLSNI